MKTKINGILTLLLAFVVQMTFAQERTISGVVSDDMGPVTDISVKVKGTNTGAVTDFDGNYSVKAKTGDTLVFSHVSYGAVEKVVSASSKIDVLVKMTGSTLDEVIVTAMGIKRRPDEITTSTQVIKSEALTKASATNIASALTGKVSGLKVNTTSNGVNGSKSFVLRGLRSFSGSNEALVVIDGIPSNANLLNALDPQIIESVNVMKGANGAALYGSEGSNGVIIVTTKRGVKGGKGFKVNFKSSTDFETVAYLPERQTRYGQGWPSGGEFKHFVYENGAWGPEFDGSIVPVGLPQEDGTYRMMSYESLGSDNIKEFFQTGTTFQNSISLAIGDRDAFVNFSYGNLKQEFIIKDDNIEKHNYNIKGGKKIGKFDMSVGMQYVDSNINATNSSLYGDLLQTATNIDITQFSENNSTHWNGYFNSPYWRRANQRYDQKNDRFNLSGNIGYDLNEHIGFSLALNSYLNSMNREDHTNAFVETEAVGDLTGNPTGRNVTSSFSSRVQSYKKKYGQFMTNFNYDLTNDWGFDANIGTSATSVDYDRNYISGSVLTIPGLYDISNVEVLNPPNNGLFRTGRSQTRKQGVFADATFKFKDYLFLNFTGRNDWLSWLDESNRSFFYPSAGVSFVPTKAIEGLKGDILSRLKISYSYVKTGNASAVGYASINDTYSQSNTRQGTGVQEGRLYPYNSFGNFPMGGNNAFISGTSITDPLIRPEFNINHEITITSEFLDRRITLDFSAYTGKSLDQITQVSTSLASGIAKNFINIGEANTKGFEVDLGLTPIKNENITWDLDLSYSTDKMTVVKVTDQSDSVVIFDLGGRNAGIYAEEGEVFPLIKGSDYKRDDQGRVIIGANGKPTTSGELINLGQATPKYIIGFNTNFRYKALTFSMTSDYRGGHKVYSDLKRQLAWSGYLVESAENGRQAFIFPNSVIETSPGVYEENTSTPTAAGGPGSFSNHYSEIYGDVASNMVIDASAFKIREMSLSFDIPNKLITKTGLTGLSIGIQARNPITILSKENKGYVDPESAFRTDSKQVGYSDVGSNPPTRTYGFNLNLKF